MVKVLVLVWPLNPLWPFRSETWNLKFVACHLKMESKFFERRLPQKKLHDGASFEKKMVDE